METFLMALLLMVGWQVLKGREQRQRITLLAHHLVPLQIETLMESLTEGYLRALGEPDEQRSEALWAMLASGEEALSQQVMRLASSFARVDEASARMSRLPWAVPGASTWWPARTLDMRSLLALHADAIAAVHENQAGRSAKDKAYVMSAEIFLFQHSCHWYCRARTVASARLLAQHHSSYAQVLASVDPVTRQSYRALTGI